MYKALFSKERKMVNNRLTPYKDHFQQCKDRLQQYKAQGVWKSERADERRRND
ncbi:hypothetical protein [Microscilla marina]|uniref:Uncharacterized protein n=1 Tax=Microscilla marina ATCC 23134 TaxID=313606 RepID=A1ZZM4_MICM2|nr:hypothetical protein [Microscilla marina]EAY23795.1 hypothetical protein M23134_08467 [Microscilla marina ATCC 23134]EAY23879.1 hypothetical protein M23134_01262 [Microscilla marina ATCC 23134]EAY23893.1 hypothetical protein M23134_01269 [Microscilla marina ATCC 23134]EAY24178.1 hypothetical protein M23134_00909 [Microscilla marina ATCC 23134]